MRKIITACIVLQLALWAHHMLFAAGGQQAAAATAAGASAAIGGGENGVCTVANSGKFALIKAVNTAADSSLDPGSISITADKTTGKGTGAGTVTGAVIVERDDEVINSEELQYNENLFTVPGLFTLKNRHNLLTGSRLDYDLVKKTGAAAAFRFHSLNSHIPLQGEGKKLEIVRPDFYELEDARVNTCMPGDASWYIEAENIKVDYAANIGVARNTRFFFLGVPLFYIPWFDFPVNGNRKSGFLSPTMGVKSGNGLELALPYYLNLAPNYDLTLVPHFYSKRGMGLDAEFRYLTPAMRGHIAGSYLAGDREAKKERLSARDRYAVNFLLLRDLTPKLFFGVDYNQVSDNDYFRDFGSRTASAENANLNRQFWLNYHDEFWGGPFSAFFTVQNYQTLQNSDGTVDEPYRLEPQLTLRWTKLLPDTSEVELLGQVTNFSHATKQTGVRSLFYPKITWNISNEWGFIRPKFSVLATYYQLDDFWGRDGNGQVWDLPRRYKSRVTPIFSLDSGLMLERFFKFQSRDWVQTLEPRLFYSYIPKKEQLDFPNFDSENTDMTFAGLFRENQFTGYDRINAANNLSYSLTSRFYERSNGFETFSVGLGQRLYFNESTRRFNEEKIGLNPKNKTDTLFFAQGQITPTVSLHTDLYFNGKKSSNDRYVVGLRYKPAADKLINLRYKNDKNSPWVSAKGRKFEQVDLSFQWAVNQKYSLVGRYNYSLSDKKALEGLFGVEYVSQCRCWGVSAVYQTYLTEHDKHKNAVFFQLNLKGLGGLGVNSFDELSRSIPGYRPKSEGRE